MKYFSLFSGIGGFEIPLAELGHECVGYSEIDKYAITIYSTWFPHHHNYGDITRIEAAVLPEFDVLVGGFPCQSFSVAGKRGGFADTRGTLFFEIARIAREKQPRLLVLENVKGLLSHDNGSTFRTIIATLDDLGYDLQWQVLNSKNFGVPQNRERVFIVGHLRGTPRPEVFPFTGENLADCRAVTSNAIDANYWKGFDNHGQRTGIIQLNDPTHSSRVVFDPQGISPTLNTMQGGDRQPKIIDLKAIGSKTRRGFVKEGYTGTLDEDCFQSVNGIRRLTPTECCRLQGFPDNWVDGISDTQKYKTLGNAVTVNVVRAIMLKLL